MTAPKFRLVFLAASWSFAGVAHAQALICAADNSSCWQREYETACREGGATVSSCSTWLRSLELSPLSNAPNVRLTAAASNLALSDLTAGPGAKTEFRDKAIAIYRDVVEQDPANVQGMLGLASLVDTRDEQVGLLRRIVAADPTYVIGLESLSRTLAADPATLPESLELLERAYLAEPSGPNRWRIAGDVVLRYERVGLAKQAAQFQARVRSDYGLDLIRDGAASPETTTPARLQGALEDLCSHRVLTIFGPEPCLDGIQRAVDAADKPTQPSSRPALAEAAFHGMAVAMQTGWRLDRVAPEWRKQFEETMDRFVTSGPVSTGMYKAYALVCADPEKRIRAMEAAAALSPSDAEIVFGLGLAYLDMKRKDDAVRTLMRAKEMLPESRGVFIDKLLSAASALPD